MLIDLTLKVADSIRSASLARCVFSVTKKLEGLLESKLARSIREVGFPLARKLSLIAQTWGYSRAFVWAKNSEFVRYLAVMHLNGHFGASL